MNSAAVQRIIDVLTKAGAAGIQRTDLMVRAPAVKRILDPVIAALVARGELRIEERQGSSYRPALFYYYTPTVESSAALLTIEIPEPKEKLASRRCKWCQAHVPHSDGRPHEFCSVQCRQASAGAAGRQFHEILTRTTDPRRYNAVIELAVAADLTSRGFEVYKPATLFHQYDFVVVDVASSTCHGMRVQPARDDGSFYEGGNYDILAVVRRDGRIDYLDQQGAPWRMAGGADVAADPAPGAVLR